MKYQIDFGFPLELPAYLNLPSWRQAKHVLDLGSGDGYYATKLATYFPDKRYTCVDIDQRAIDAGRKQFAGWRNNNIEYSRADVLNYHGNFPIAIARLLVQHLDTPQDLLRAAPNFLRPGGVLIVIDSDDRSRLFWPTEKCRRIERFFCSFSEFQPGRKYSAKMVDIAPSYGFESKVHHLLLIPSSLPSYKNLFYRSYQLFFQIVQEHYRMEFDYKSLFDELDEWLTDRSAYAHIGVKICIFTYESSR